MAHISFLTYGTRGDVEPLLALALKFRNDGHDIGFAAPIDFESWVRAYGLAFQPTTKSPIVDLVANPVLEDLMHFRLLKIPKALKTLKSFTCEVIVEAMPDAVGATDLIISHAGLAIATDIAEKRGAKLLYVSPIPALATRAFPIVPFVRSWGVFNRLSYLPLRFARSFTPSLYKDARARLGLPPVSALKRSFYLDGKPVPIVHGFSKHLIPRPDDWPAHGWVTGNLFLDAEGEDWAPGAQLAAFLKAGPPPVYVGFGSMNIGKAAGLAETIIVAARALGVRLLLARGWAGLEVGGGLAGGDLFQLGEVPHHKLFPHVRAVVHHGGAGTTAAGLRAGKPTLICPFGFDQPWWGALVHRRGLGPAPLPQKRMTAARFEAALRDLINNGTYAANAQQMAALMASEDGVNKTARTIEDWCGL